MDPHNLDRKSNESTAFAPLLDRLDLADVVITARRTLAGRIGYQVDDAHLEHRTE